MTQKTVKINRKTQTWTYASTFNAKTEACVDANVT